MQSRDVEVVLVGGGIAGSALGRALATSGIDVLILEKTREFADENRGELMWPWGVAEAKRLDVFEILVAAGARTIPTVAEFDEISEEVQVTLRGCVDGIDGSLNIRHPVARQALMDAAEAGGAVIRRSVSTVSVDIGARPSVRWTDEEGEHRLSASFIVGADGRRSVVQRQAGFVPRRAPIEHYSAGALIRGADIPEDVNTVAREGDKMLISFPQGHGMHRTYLVFSTEAKGRYTGPAGEDQFLADCALECLPGSEAWAGAELLQPLGTFPCGDTWIDEPVRNGVALIGDAGGYNNFLIGQGLSLAMRDAAELADRLRAGDWSSGALRSYGHERSERLERARIRAAMAVMIERGFRDDPRGRECFTKSLAGNELVELVGATVFTGGHDIPLSDYRTVYEQYRMIEASLAA